jgi:serine/threonine-protein kinase RsbW
MTTEAGPVKGPEKKDLFDGDSWVLPTELDVDADASRALRSRLQALGWEEGTREDVGTALGEAIWNAIKHGNKLNPNKKIFVSLKIDKNKLSITVRDEGEGFDPENVSPVETEGEGFGKPSGRGLSWMKAFCDSVTYNEKGNEVTLVKERK